MVRTSAQLQQLFQKSKQQKEKEAKEKQELKSLKSKEKAKRYRQTHRVELSISQKRYRALHQEELKEYQKRYREEHREELREKQRQYREQHQEYYKTYWHNRWIGEPLPNVNDYQQPPVKNKKETKAVYEKWLKHLKAKEPFLTEDKLYFNHLMQASVEQTLKDMGRTKLTVEQIKDQYQAIQDNLTSLQEHRRQVTTDEEKNNLTRRISRMKASLANFKSRYHDVLEGRKPQPHIPRTQVKTKLQEIEEKAKQMMALAKTDEERKVIEQQLYYTRLRYKYSCC